MKGEEFVSVEELVPLVTSTSPVVRVSLILSDVVNSEVVEENGLVDSSLE